ncbi:hypothetical protein Tco_1203388 [Tanacetum coccineum]
MTSSKLTEVLSAFRYRKRNLMIIGGISSNRGKRRHDKIMFTGQLITSSGWPFVSTVLGQMAHLVASIILNSTSISFNNFLPSVLWLVAVVVVVGVAVTVVVVVMDKGYRKVPIANVTLFSSAHLLRENTDSVRSNQRMRPTAPSVPLK